MQVHYERLPYSTFLNKTCRFNSEPPQTWNANKHRDRNGGYDKEYCAARQPLTNDLPIAMDIARQRFKFLMALQWSFKAATINVELGFHGSHSRLDSRNLAPSNNKSSLKGATLLCFDSKSGGCASNWCSSEWRRAADVWTTVCKNYM